MNELVNPQAKFPSGIPVNSIATTVGANRFGEYSDAMETTGGNAAPRPRPVKNRKATSSLYVLARAVSKLKMPKVIVESTTTHLRPQRSAMGPAAMAASIKPKRLAEKTYPIVFRGIWRFSEIAAPRVPAVWALNPSKTKTRPQRRMV